MAQKPSLPKGTRDFGPEQMLKRNYIIDSIKDVFKKYGFMPLETPAMENLSVLTGKYGDEGDQLLFRVLNTGDFLSKSHVTDLILAKAYIFSSIVEKYIYLLIDDNTRDFRVFNKEILNKALQNYYKAPSEPYRLLKDKKELDVFLRESIEPILQSFLEATKNSDLTNQDNLQHQIRLFLEQDLPRMHKSSLLKSSDLVGSISEKGLKYDLTVPFARYVVMNQTDITFPFKRYQIQPVWRADRPQRGRYREFFQCDADIVGTNSLVCEAELLAMVQEVYKKFNFDAYTISLSNRKILEGIAETCGAKNEFNRFCVILDKLDKIGSEKVFQELEGIGITKDSLIILEQILNISGHNNSKLEALAKIIRASETGMLGIEETKETLNNLSLLGFLTDKVSVDFTLARGLSYYTGMIYEVKPTSIQMGTITAGGRYDNLTGVFGLQGISGVGISFGIDRIYDTLEELNLFPNSKANYSKVLVVAFDEESQKHGLKLLGDLRAAGIAAEIYPEPAKMKKQLGYADKKAIPFVLLVGSEEIEKGQYTLKYMETGNQASFTIEEVINNLLEEQE